MGKLTSYQAFNEFYLRCLLFNIQQNVNLLIYITILFFHLTLGKLKFYHQYYFYQPLFAADQ